MKKYLLTLALAAVAISASAESYCLYDKDNDKGTWTADGAGFKIEKKFGDVTITITTDKGSATTALKDPSSQISWRVYKNSSFTITSSVDLKGVKVTEDTYTESDGKGYTGELSLSDGWTGALAENIFTASSKGSKTLTATAAANQVRIARLEVSTDGNFDVVTPADGVIYTNAFNSSLDGWNNTAEAEKEWDGWYINSKIGCATVSSYSKNDGNFPGTAWLSKEFDLANYKNVKLTVEQAFGFYFPQSQDEFATLNVRLAGQTEWSQLAFSNFPAAPDGSNWSKFAANEFDLSEFDGEKIELGFCYKNTDGASKSWEIKNFKLEGDKTEGAVENIAVDENAPVVYYNLQGQRVNNPENGIFVRVQGGKAVKVAK